MVCFRLKICDFQRALSAGFTGTWQMRELPVVWFVSSCEGPAMLLRALGVLEKNSNVESVVFEHETISVLMEFVTHCRLAVLTITSSWLRGRVGVL